MLKAIAREKVAEFPVLPFHLRTGEKGLEQGTPVLIHEIAFKAFVVTNALAFIFSICALAIHF
ncbi:hypothetical protein Gogos_020814, partial [Gossypium gossypioides]|nr:hypothetical protein [Gossypium gossypioides]